MAAGTLFVLDASLPGGLVEGVGRHPLRADDGVHDVDAGATLQRLQRAVGRTKRVCGLFSNHWLWAAVGLSLVLQAAVLYIPFLQQAFSTEGLTAGDWLRCAAVASAVLWVRELSKVMTGGVNRRRATGPEI